jgi:hypothetical protein
MDVLPLGASVREWGESGYQADLKSSQFLLKLVKAGIMLTQ